MRFGYVITLLSVSVCCAWGLQQAPSVAEPPPEVAAPSNQSPPAPLTQEQREKQIRMYDPLDQGDPLLNGRAKRAVPAEVPSVTPDSPNSPDARRRDAAPKPLPGSVAESNIGGGLPHRPGPQVLPESGEEPVQEYSGPAVLSRSYTITRPSVPQEVRWSPTLSYLESFDTGVNALPGAKPSAVYTGYLFSWSLTGRHYWKHDQFGVQYQGSRARVGGGLGLSGTSQSLNADYEHQISRRLRFNLVVSASSLSQLYSLQTPGLGLGDSIANVNLAASPTLQVLDTGTRQLTNQATVTWQKSARMSFSAGSGVFFTERTGGLIGNTGLQANADASYRYTRRTTIGAYYNFTGFTYTHRVTTANLQTLGGIYSYALGRSTQIRLRGGLTRIENQGQQLVAIDPAIAIYLGQGTAIVENYHRAFTSDISAQLVRDFGRRASGDVSYVRGASPGNGLLLTSVQEGYSANFRMRVHRNYSLSFGAGRSSLKATSGGDPHALNIVGNYDTQSYGMSLSRPLAHHLAADFRMEYRTYDITNMPQFNHQFRITTGLSWNPGENWLKSW